MSDVKRSLKILFLANRIPYPVVDGQSRRTYNILKGLSKNNEVHFFSLYERSKRVDPKAKKHLREFCSSVEFIEGPNKHISWSMTYRLIRSIFSREPYTIWRSYSYKFKKRVLELLSNKMIDIVHCDILPIAYTLKYLSKKVPCVLTDHDVSYLKTLRMGKNCENFLLKLFLNYETVKLKRLERNIFLQVNMGITVSENDKQYLEDLNPNSKFYVIENGVDTKLFVGNMCGEKKNILWIGGLNDYSNNEAMTYFLKKIYPIVKEADEDITMTIVGGGESKLSKIYEKDKTIIFTGFVDDPVQYLNRATIFVAPILSGSGTRLKLLEAMSARKGIVSTSIGCEGIEGEDKVHFLLADSAKQFAEKIILLLNDEKLRNKISENAWNLAKQKYEWNIIINKINILYHQIVDNKI